MKTREEKIAELSESDRLLLEYYELADCRTLNMIESALYDYGKKIYEMLNNGQVRGIER